jgi:hypothetical protein
VNVIQIQLIEGNCGDPQSWYWFVPAGNALVAGVDACTKLPGQDHAYNELAHCNVHVTLQRIQGSENVASNKPRVIPR